MIDRFMKHVSPEPNSGCWLWTGAVNNQGYGRFMRPGKPQGEYAHRVAFELFKRPLRTGEMALHICDRGKFGCVNPAHLYAGGARENARDRQLAGTARGPAIKMHCPLGHPRAQRPNGKWRCFECDRTQLRVSRARRNQGGLTGQTTS